MSNANGGKGPRTVALVGPYGSGKTTLLESILFATGAAPRKGSVAQNNTVGDSTPEARARQMSVELNCATTSYLDQSFTFLDCPGSIEFLAGHAVRASGRGCGRRRHRAGTRQGADAEAVSEASGGSQDSPSDVRQQDRQGERLAARNSRDAAGSQRYCRCCCARFRSGKTSVVTGFVDLALERAFAYRDARAVRDRSTSPTRTAKRKRASRCSKGSPITTSI